MAESAILGEGSAGYELKKKLARQRAEVGCERSGQGDANMKGPRRRPAGLGQDQVLDKPGRAGAKAFGHLVQEQDLGATDQGDGNGHLAPHP